MPAVLETQGLEKHFGGIAAANDVSLQVEKGARHALIGPNGAGKTTVINLLTGVLRPTAGRILLEGAGHHRARSRTSASGSASPAPSRSTSCSLDLTPLETIGLAISERMGTGAAVVAAGRLQGRRGRGDRRDPRALPSRRRDVRAHRQPALRQAAPARDRARHRLPAARAAARRAGGGRARGRAARNPRRRSRRCRATSPCC